MFIEAQGIDPEQTPIIIAPQPVTRPAAGVIATRPENEQMRQQIRSLDLQLPTGDHSIDGPKDRGFLVINHVTNSPHKERSSGT